MARKVHALFISVLPLLLAQGLSGLKDNERGGCVHVPTHEHAHMLCEAGLFSVMACHDSPRQCIYSTMHLHEPDSTHPSESDSH